MVSWPEEYGGRGASLWQWLIFEEEYYRAGAPQRVTQNGIFLLAPTIFEFGTQEQKDRFLPAHGGGRGPLVPGLVASPTPAATSPASRAGPCATTTRGGWRLNGQKTWTTRGAFCTHLFGLFRTDPDAERHRGLTYFLVPLDTEGVTVRGFGRLDGDEGFAEVFFEDAFVPDDRRARRASTRAGAWPWPPPSSERGLTLRSPGRFMAAADRLVDLYQRARRRRPTRRSATTSCRRGSTPRPTSSTRCATSPTWSRAGRRAPGRASTRSSGPSSTCASTRRRSACSARYAELEADAPGAVDGGAWMKGYQFSLSGPIYAGTNEIQRNIVAERVLGLPRK